jgi:hypothetical protein
MKKSLLSFVIIMILAFQAKSQCTGGTLAGSITPTGVWQTTGTTNVDGNKYYTFVATAGFTYYFSFCPIDGGSSTFDTELTILDNANVPMAGGYNDDNCGSQSYIAWTCPLNGTYRILPTRFSCNNRVGLGRLAYKNSLPLSCPSNLGGGTTAVPALPYASGAGTTCGSANDLTSSNVIACGSTSYLGGEDRVWVFTPAITGTVTINLTSTGTWNGLMLYEGCPLLGQGGNCIDVSQSSLGNQSITACLTGGLTYYLILDVFPSPNCNPYSNLTISAPVPVGGCSLGTGINNITLPYASSGRTTCGKVNDLTDLNTITCGSTLYFTGEDEVFVFTPSTSGNISINLTSSGSYTGVTLYEGCPSANSCSGAAGVCVAYAQSSTGSKGLCANVTSGITYYLIVDSWATPTCNPFDISVSAPTALLPGATCANAVPIASLPYNVTNQSTSCLGNDYSNASAGSCGTLYESGEDKVYVYTAIAAECLSITLSGASSNSIGFQVYNGCPDAGATNCVGSAGGANSGTLTGSIILPSAGTYYIVVDSWAAPDNVQYSMNITSFGAGATNDLPCNATPIILGIPYSGSNNCSGSLSEPVAPSCWTTPNTRNTVWYSVAAPASGQLRIRAIPNSLTNTQIAIYSGVCGTAMTLVGCNDDATACGTTTNYSSDLTVAGLIAGATYYIVVDGYADLVGTFSLLAFDATQPLLPLTNGQDCGIYLPVCDTAMSFGNPGFQSFGNICDFSGGGTNCLLSGERSSVWFEIPINANGNLEFSIIPKDWPGAPSTAGTDYDFAVWRTLGTGAVTCAQIATGAAPISCNYSFLGLTGTFGAVAGTSPAAYPGFGTAFQQRIPVLAGERYILVVSNFSNSTAGFDVIFSQTAPILYGSSGSTSNWSAGIDTDWFKTGNWGGCPVPTCSRDANITGGLVLQPIITGAVASCKSIVINPGATLTIPAAQTLLVCENFTNFGTFSAAPTSTVLFGNAAVNQNLNGNLIAPNSFGNLTVTKTGGMVSILQNTQVRGKLSITNATSSFTMNAKNLFVGGDFSNIGDFIPSTGMLEFNGTAPQAYLNSGLNGALLRNVKMNHNGSGVTLLTNMQISTTGNLDLILGKIVTNAFEVVSNNRTPASVTAGNSLSFVQGKLRRFINATGSYNFPIGHSTKGYQLANIDFSNGANPTSIDNILAVFAPHGALPVALGTTDCGITYSTSGLDNGFWTFTASNNPTSGLFDLTLYNSNYGNAASRWTIQSFNGSAWVLANGNCVVSPVTAVKRTAMSNLGIYSTAQGPVPLGVDLVALNATPFTNYIQLKWQTASEENNAGFEILKSNSQGDFKAIGWKDGIGNSNSMSSYSFDDRDVVPFERYYYKLRQVDFDGNSKLTNEVSAIISQKENSIEVTPNPINENSQITLNTFEDGNFVADLYDVYGKFIKRIANKNVSVGKHTFSVSSFWLELEPGIYAIRVSINDWVKSVNIVVIN